MSKDSLDYYPVFLDLKGRSVVVIGGGVVAERKVGTLIKSGADVTVISPALTKTLKEWNTQQKIEILQRPYELGDLAQSTLAFTATEHAEVNRAVVSEAQKEGIFINVADQSVPGDFLVPAIFSSEANVTVAVSTGGKNPSLAVKIRDRIKAFLTKAESL